MHSVLQGNPAAPWVGPGLAERLKKERASEAKKKDKKNKKKMETYKSGGHSDATNS
jgi:hypothetical protein